MTMQWMTVFIDLPADGVQTGTAFWSEVTGSVRFDPWGAEGEFATLEPAEGDPYLGVQRLRSGAGEHRRARVPSAPARPH